jgi:CheY-like chemotaxis protein
VNKGQTILLVDDSENDMILMRAAFDKAQFDIGIQEVSNGDEAIAYLKGEGIYSNRAKYPLPSAVILDINMPFKNGIEVLRWARAEPSLDLLPMIVMTASMRVEDVKAAYKMGANSYLVKPIKFADLAEMIGCLRFWLRLNHFPPENEMVAR